MDPEALPDRIFKFFLDTLSKSGMMEEEAFSGLKLFCFEGGSVMVSWNNLDTLKSYQKMEEKKEQVDLKEVLSGDAGAQRVKEYCVPMAEGLAYNFAAKKVNADQTAAIQDGKAEFSGLRSGLYLIVMPKADKTGASITPFLISVPDKAGNYAITAKPKPEIKAPTQTVTPTPTPKVPGKPKLPQTGQLWWPVVLMAGAGFILVLGGMWLRRRPETKKQ